MVSVIISTTEYFKAETEFLICAAEGQHESTAITIEARISFF